MSQTETLMLVALGFAVASLLALVIGRSLWKLARRMQTRRLRSEIPAVVAELRAERDRLRVEFAMLSRKFDVRLAAMKASHAEAMAEVSRHRNRLELLAESARKRETILAEREREMGSLREQLDPLESELARRTEVSQRLEQQVHERNETIAGLNREIAELKETLAEQDQELAALEGRAEPRLLPPPVAPEILTAQERLSRRIEDLTALSHQIAGQRERFVEERDKFSALRQAIALPAPPSVEDALDLKESREHIDVIDEQGRAIEEKLVAAESESEALVKELRSLDEAWSKKIDELAASPEPSPAAANENAEALAEPELAPPEEATPAQRAAGNVVSLAARIRALQRDVTH
jgi:predicted  nucleic acid-binding Zn-ribbon protein